jgi:hypothetical protein
MHRLLILARRAADYRRLVDDARLPDLDVMSTSDLAEATPRAAEFDLVFGEPSLLRSLLPSLTALQWAQVTWAGVEPLLDPSLRRDYTLTNARGVFGGLMSEYVFGYLLAHERRLLEKHAAQLAARWDPTPPGSLRGKQLGLLGVGTIGAALARTAKHFGMRVKGFTRASEDSADVDAYFHGSLAEQRDAFAGDLDYLVSIMPATGATRLLVDASLLASLPPRRLREPGARRHRRRNGPRAGPERRDHRRRGARRFPAGAAPARPRLLEDAESADYLAHRGAQFPGGHHAGVRRQLPAPAARRTSALPGRFRAGLLTRCR